MIFRKYMYMYKAQFKKLLIKFISMLRNMLTASNFLWYSHIVVNRFGFLNLSIPK